MNVQVRSTTGDVGTRALVALVVFLGSATFSSHAADTGLAKVTAVQNAVETKTASQTSWSATTAGRSLGAKDRIRTGAASRAAILYSDQTLHRMNEKSEVEILPPADGGSGIVKILSGQSYFTSRTPKDFGRVQTPTVTAAIKGTEFAVAVAETGTTIITMIEGTVEASNEFGRVTVTRGEEAVSEPGKAPQRRIVVRSRDAVAWSLYYPRVLGGAHAGDDRLSRAAAQLSNGQVESARALIEEARAANPGDPVALALASVVALAGDRRDEARALADQAVAADASSPPALLARSFVAQADFDLVRARDLAENAAALDPASAEALARAAELRLAMGDHEGARKAAEKAVEREPGNSRALSVLGFVNLAAYRTKDANRDFDRAVEADSGFALAHAGRGIAQIRLGHVDGGREELQTAAMLDPAESLYRSYLGKAYYEERRAEEAGEELAAAKELDPKDPTPWLYSAILMQNENRPIEALTDLNGAMTRNDNRAVYRSRLLLDEDRAVRGVDLARIYGDLGFNALGLVSARRSADDNQAEFSSHLFLAGNYRNLSGFASSFLSETLQARIYQPVGANAARPDVSGGTVAFNEYTALFDRPRARGFVTATYGYTDTGLDELFPECASGGPCATPYAIEDSRNWSGNLTGTYNGDRIAASVGVRKLEDDGFRKNNDQGTTVYTAFLQGAASERDTIQFNAIVGNRETGDLPLRQLPVLIKKERFETDELNLGLGWHRKVSPATDVVLSAIWNRTEATGLTYNSTMTTVTGTTDVSIGGPQLETQVVHRRGRATWIAGGGVFDGTFEYVSSPFAKGDEQFANAYAYFKYQSTSPVAVVGGLAVEAVDAPIGLLPPRDSKIGASDVTYKDARVSPKLGVTATLASGTTLRAAVFSRLASSIGRLQTLEPTQVSGFNQFYEDSGGTRSWNFGLGFDQQFIQKIFFGASWLRRSRTVPEAVCLTPLPSSGCANIPGTELEDKHSDDDLGSLYVNALLGKRVAASILYDLEFRDFDTTTISPLGSFQDRMKTERIRPQIRVFLPIGFYASLAGTHYDQEVDQYENLNATARRCRRG